MEDELRKYNLHDLRIGMTELLAEDNEIQGSGD